MAKIGIDSMLVTMASELVSGNCAQIFDRNEDVFILMQAYVNTGEVLNHYVDRGAVEEMLLDSFEHHKHILK